MSGERDAILKRVKDALAPLPQRAAKPDYDSALELTRVRVDAGDPVAEFTARMRAVNGDVVMNPSELADLLRQRGWSRGYCDPVLWPLLGPFLGADFQVEQAFDRTRVDDYQFGITRAVGAIAETGTVVLNDATTSSRLAALAPWAHIAVVPRNALYPDLIAAVAALGDDPNVIWCTGPSKTADVEGILIEGVHGPGAQVALFVD
ncbi:MAG TPA: LUD domain-containing protein [Opitutaceae bacterium]|jgi:L-lactate dehydrogenase complex protein LldG|nr:LUD domain-containing protein [Opitutaceae bacterium]